MHVRKTETNGEREREREREREKETSNVRGIVELVERHGERLGPGDVDPSLQDLAHATSNMRCLLLQLVVCILAHYLFERSLRLRFHIPAIVVDVEDSFLAVNDAVREDRRDDKRRAFLVCHASVRELGRGVFGRHLVELSAGRRGPVASLDVLDACEDAVVRAQRHGPGLDDIEAAEEWYLECDCEFL